MPIKNGEVVGTRATFFRIEGGKNLRTDFMEGMFYEPPKVGEGFKIYGDGIRYGTRMIYTSDVKNIELQTNGYTIHTITGSTYGIQENQSQE